MVRVWPKVWDGVGRGAWEAAEEEPTTPEEILEGVEGWRWWNGGVTKVVSTTFPEGLTKPFFDIFSLFLIDSVKNVRQQKWNVDYLFRYVKLFPTFRAQKSKFKFFLEGFLPFLSFYVFYPLC